MSASVVDAAATVLVDTFARAGVVDSAGVQFAHRLHRFRPEEPDTVLLAAALALRAPQWGHVCIDPQTIAGTVVVDDGGDGSVAGLPWPEPDRWATQIHDSALVSVETARRSPTADLDELRPLVWDGTRLYLHRYWEYESQVAEHVLRRCTLDLPREPRPPLPAFDLLFPPDDVESQRRAAVAVLAQPFTIITGGPGTGKTHTIAGAVAALYGRSFDNDQNPSERPLHIALAAPTGKAAQRLTEALRVPRSGASEIVAEAMSRLEAMTIHRLIGARRDRFVHHAGNPLPADVVIIDETSMVSLPLMARLLDAVRPDATVVLVGDPHQLASVEAGSVLRDLVHALPDGIVIELDQVFRQASSSAIIPFAQAVRSGDIAGVLALLADSDTPLTLVSPQSEAAVHAVEQGAVDHAEAVVARAANPAAALEHLQRLRVLTATRRGPNGRAAWNQRIEQRLAPGGRGGDRFSRRWYAGRPVIVTENDYLNQLMNGDIGIAVPGDDGDGLAVAFDRGDAVELISPTRLQAIETVWAMTIHKSQGSEFSSVIVTLPEAASPLLTRELLYTAVTRAKQSVLVVATEAAVRAAVGRPISRSSGLAGRLAAAIGDGTEVRAGDDRHREAATPRQLRLWD